MAASQAQPEVAVLIPAYQAESFIDRTLYFARGQTHTRLRILVAVDRGTDATAAKVARHAREDARVSVYPHGERLGWVGNVNFLLDQVRSPFYCLYFHDDVLLPQYVGKLLAALHAHPDAASVHCDMDHFGAERPVSVGHARFMPTVPRLLDFMLLPRRGSPLRSLVRSEAGAGLRLPQTGSHGLWANEVFLLELLALGPAAHVGEALYARWNQRPGGLTDSWAALPYGEILAGWRAVAAHAVALFERIAPGQAALDALVHALYLRLVPTVQAALAHQAPSASLRPADLHPRFARVDPDFDLTPWGAEIGAWARQRMAELVRAQGGQHAA